MIDVKNIKDRLTALEDRLLTGDVLLTVRLPDGSTKEVTLEEYRQHSGEWDFVKVTQCKTPQAAAEILTLWVGETAVG